jgi:hypothetical protein
LHDNAQTHTATCTTKPIQELRFEVSDHSACSLDLAPLDFHLFEPLKGALRGWFSDDKVKEAVHEWLCTQPKQFFIMISQSLWTTGQSVLRSKETYVKKWNTCSLPY